MWTILATLHYKIYELVNCTILIFNLLYFNPFGFGDDSRIGYHWWRHVILVVYTINDLRLRTGYPLMPTNSWNKENNNNRNERDPLWYVDATMLNQFLECLQFAFPRLCLLILALYHALAHAYVFAFIVNRSHFDRFAPFSTCYFVSFFFLRFVLFYNSISYALLLVEYRKNRSIEAKWEK